jgi:hypothetical protein
MRPRIKKFAIPVNEENRELIEFLRGYLPSDKLEGNYYFTFTINLSGSVANRRFQHASKMYDIDEYHRTPALTGVIIPA